MLISVTLMLFSLSTKLTPKEGLNLKLFFVDCLCRADRERSLIKIILVESVRTKWKGERDWSVTY